MSMRNRFNIGPSPFNKTPVLAPLRRPPPIIGFSFGTLFKGMKSLKSLKKMDWKNIRKTSKTLGPAVATVYPPAGAVIYGALAIDKTIKKGGPKGKKAKKQKDKIAVAALGGNTKAQHMLQAFGGAQDVRNNIQNTKLLKASARGNKKATRRLQNISTRANMGDKRAIKKLGHISNALGGITYYRAVAARKAQRRYY